MSIVNIAGRPVGDGQPVFVIAEIGINHNGSMELAKQLIDAAADAGCDAVKFQKRTPEACVPRDQWDVMRDTPWGRMTYLEYRHKVEFTFEEYVEIDGYCKERGVLWTASCWDLESVDFMGKFKPSFFKAASASLTDIELLKAMKSYGPLIISTGMSTWEEIEYAISQIGTDNLLVAHSTSAYPCPVEELNLNMIHTLKQKYPELPVGYSGHETGLATTWAAVGMGATFIERHITLDRAMWGSDQAASVEPGGLMRLVANIRDIETAKGDGVKKVYDSELKPKAKLRRVQSIDTLQTA